MAHAFQRPHRARHLALLLALLVLVAGLGAPAVAAPRPTHTLVPVGSGYTSETLQRFTQAAIQHDTSGNVYLLVFSDSTAAPALLPPTTAPAAYATAIRCSVGVSATTCIAIVWSPPRI